MKRFSALIVGATLLSTSTVAYGNDYGNDIERQHIAIEDVQTQNNITIISDQEEIARYMQGENISIGNEDIVEIIRVTFPEEKKVPSIDSRIIFRDYYSKYVSSGSSTESMASINYSHPAGIVYFSEEYNSSWTVSASGGLKTEVIEAALGYSVTQGNRREYKWESERYPYNVNVKGYLNYNYETRGVYDRDLVFDDYIGTVTTRQHTGYTIIVTRG